jgi:hypothetical protein
VRRSLRAAGLLGGGAVIYAFELTARQEVIESWSFSAAEPERLPGRMETQGAALMDEATAVAYFSERLPVELRRHLLSLPFSATLRAELLIASIRRVTGGERLRRLQSTIGTPVQVLEPDVLVNGAVTRASVTGVESLSSGTIHFEYPTTYHETDTIWIPRPELSVPGDSLERSAP